ncbi:hypothetical protein FACS189449_10060 [Alphaproteobacteria bacterium]|nr:hypothetical protein FACS189449_10060 [Alphaproteobacteria bacterium]
MNYKNIFAFILLFFVQLTAFYESFGSDPNHSPVNASKFANQRNVEDYRPSWYPRKSNPTWDEVADAYENYCAAQTPELKRTLIVGAGRGQGRWNTRDGKWLAVARYAETAYGNPDLYILIDISEEFKPDINADVRTNQLEEILERHRYDYVIFEGLEPALGALKFLKKNCCLIARPYHTIKSTEDQRFQYAKDGVKKGILQEINFGPGKIYYNLAARAYGCPVFVDGETYRVYKSDKTNFLNNLKPEYMSVHDLKDGKATIAFETLKPGTEKWPQKYEGTDDSATANIIMVIKKLTD